MWILIRAIMLTIYFLLQEGVTRIGPQDQFEEPQIGIYLFS